MSARGAGLCLFRDSTICRVSQRLRINDFVPHNEAWVAIGPNFVQTLLANFNAEFGTQSR
jgi:hypothetical protein